MNMILYKNIKNYKYQLLKTYTFPTGIATETNLNIGNPDIKSFVEISRDGRLRIEAGYAWDGPSGPTNDTKNFIRGSLVHDALYQLMREKKLDFKSYRKQADLVLKKICLEDGMSSFRASYVYNFVRWFGESSAKPSDERAEWRTAP
ncbi:hypothetical protein EHQ12_05745 [Leptospira gomenensis]|uniref:DUF1353 domain-containing protein n=1 Tax=Leptospira gomenensis TaxID=2484974 RepID=A0A5F1YZ85_9LEPT|nr:hypothetical protein [Leptospira gomenensis]TGK36046.1 hypothetical protein EHQ17_05575 [Leptospira gomenensis]TGK41791.1 hypothetical protein EHQ12_05745 [Leptospira gomenensis]TGK53351.1 hypothetical protein EHQ07_00155 [Leptospira gomenensis]TGK64957.1 hypothetical protein EHQ13_06400 [Leptospira gomenensis]